MPCLYKYKYKYKYKKNMKTLNKEELKAVAADVFGRYNKAEKVAVTSDGMAFITDEGDNAVKNYSKKNASGRELAITRFTRDEIESASKDKSVKELITEIESATDVTVVDALLNAENIGKKRKSVIDAADKKLKELKTKA